MDRTEEGLSATSRENPHVLLEAEWEADGWSFIGAVLGPDEAETLARDSVCHVCGSIVARRVRRNPCGAIGSRASVPLAEAVVAEVALQAQARDRRALLLLSKGHDEDGRESRAALRLLRHALSLDELWRLFVAFLGCGASTRHALEARRRGRLSGVAMLTQVARPPTLRKYGDGDVLLMHPMTLRVADIVASRNSIGGGGRRGNAREAEEPAMMTCIDLWVVRALERACGLARARGRDALTVLRPLAAVTRSSQAAGRLLRNTSLRCRHRVRQAQRAYDAPQPASVAALARGCGSSGFERGIRGGPRDARRARSDCCGRDADARAAHARPIPALVRGRPVRARPSQDLVGRQQAPSSRT